MIPSIGVMIAAYTVVRLLQIAIEADGSKSQRIIVALLSLAGVAIIVLSAVTLLLTAGKLRTAGNVPVF
jgi:hypothetical protein